MKNKFLVVIALAIAVCLGVCSLTAFAKDTTWTEHNQNTASDCENGSIKIVNDAASDAVYHRYAYSDETFDISGGLKIAFTINEAPYYKEDNAEYDGWLGLYVQMEGDEKYMPQQSKGIQFLIRPFATNDSATSEKMKTDVYVKNDTTQAQKTEIVTSASVIGKHYLSIIRTDIDSEYTHNYKIVLDGTLVDYSSDTDFLRLAEDEKFNNPLVLANAYIAPTNTYGKWDVDINEIEEIKAKNNWVNVDYSDVKTSGESTYLMARAGKSGEINRYMYTKGLSLSKKDKSVVEIKLDLSRQPSISENADSYTVLSLVKAYSEFDHFEKTAISLLLKTKDAKTMLIAGGDGLKAEKSNVKEFAVSQNEPLIIKMGFNSAGEAVVTVNETIKFFSNDIKESNYILSTAYLSLSQVNCQNNANATPWGAKIYSVKTLTEDLPLYTAPPEKQPDKKGCGSVFSVENNCLALVLACVFTLALGALLFRKTKTV